ncbi:MAG: hypothetical protein AAFU64_12315 [Bacteroidota bacterium]
MTSQHQTSKQYFTVLGILHIAMLMGQVIFLGVVFFILNSEGAALEADPALELIMQVGIAVFIVMGLFGGNFLFKRLVVTTREKSSLGEKLKAYQTACVVRFALLEAPAILCIVAFFLTGNYFFAGLSLVVILVFLMNRPTKTKLMMDLELSGEEKTTLDDPEAVIH